MEVSFTAMYRAEMRYFTPLLQVFYFSAMIYAQTSGERQISLRPPALHVPGVLDVSTDDHAPVRPGLPEHAVTIMVRNLSEKPVRGYVIDLQLRKGSKQSLAWHHAQAMILTYAGGQPRDLGPGEIESSPNPVALPVLRIEGRIVCSFVVDSVEYSDGTKWGPAKLPESAYIIGFFANLDRLSKNR